MKKELKRCICIAISLLILLSTSGWGIRASAVSQAEIDALEVERDELRERQEYAAEQLEALQQSMKNTLDQKALLDEQSALLWQDIELINSQIGLYDDLIADKKAEAEAAEEEKEEHYKLYSARVREMEEGSTWSYLSYVIGADSISELIARLMDISDIMSYDEKLRDNYTTACEIAAETLAEYEEVQAKQKTKQAELEMRQAELDEKIAASVAVLVGLEEDIDAYMAYEESVAAEMAEVQELIDKKAEELRRQQETEAAAKNPVISYPASGTVSSGYYMWPSATTYITSPFGPRVHPIYGQLKPHTGVDIGAWYGTEIYAAASGTVSMAVVDYGSTGYGTYVAIYHPNGTITLYGHMSALAVSSGQSVSKGQVIGYVGSTGASNGPHIHFEIRQNGVCVDPMRYFSS